nr:replication associated protein [Flumine microvirus 27]
MPQCSTPIALKGENKEEIIVPCGKCAACKLKRSSEWSFRLMQEEKRSCTAVFLTLTYDYATVPVTPRGFMSLRIRDIQLFFKRLRKLQKNAPRQIHRLPIRYYAVGEYGTQRHRPHYHIILFNAQLDLIAKAWSIDGKMIGHIHYGTVGAASVGYSLKYISKPSKIPLHQNDDRQKEKALMSKGLGANYLTPSMVYWHRQDIDNRMYVTVSDTQKAAMPRYYKQRIYKDYERKSAGHLALQKLKEREYELAAKNPIFARNKIQSQLAAELKRLKYSQQNIFT